MFTKDKLTMWYEACLQNSPQTVQFMADEANPVGIAEYLDRDFHASTPQEALHLTAGGSEKLSSHSLPRVTCCITYGGDHGYLDECLLSINAQTHRPDKILLGIDNDSNCVSLPPLDIPVETHYFSGHNGPFQVMEKLISMAGTEFVMLQDSDDLAHPQRLAIQLKTQHQSDADLVGSGVAHFASPDVVEKVAIFAVQPIKFLTTTNGNALLYPSSLMRVTSFHQAGGFQHFSKFGIDTEFVNRMVLNGNATNVPMPLYLKRRRTDSLTGAASTGFGSEARNKVREWTQQKYARLISQTQSQNQHSSLCKGE